MSPGKLDVAVIKRHLAALDRALKQLRRHTGKPVEQLHDLDELWPVERGLQLCAQNALDIAMHLAASEGLDTPDYASAIDNMTTIGVLDAGFARSFRAIAGFRNILVHGYLEVDPTHVHALLNEHLDDFERFAEAVSAYLPAR